MANLMAHPTQRAFFCWFVVAETIEDAWECEAASPREAAEAYWAHVDHGVEALIRVGSAAFSETWRVDSGGEAHCV